MIVDNRSHQFGGKTLILSLQLLTSLTVVAEVKLPLLTLPGLVLQLSSFSR